jgi:hypothetical protein
MSDKVKNWYESLSKDLKRESKLDKNYKKHLIQPNSMICCIGGTGSGKTNALCDWLSRKNESFYDIIIFTGSTSDEPLYSMLKQKMPDIQLFNDIAELPELKEFDNEDKGQEKLLVLDDFINLPSKDQKKIKHLHPHQLRERVPPDRPCALKGFHCQDSVHEVFIGLTRFSGLSRRESNSRFMLSQPFVCVKPNGLVSNKKTRRMGNSGEHTRPGCEGRRPADRINLMLRMIFRRDAENQTLKPARERLVTREEWNVW